MNTGNLRRLLRVVQQTHKTHQSSQQCEFPRTCGGCHFWAGYAGALRDLISGHIHPVLSASVSVSVKRQKPLKKPQTGKLPEAILTALRDGPLSLPEIRHRVPPTKRDNDLHNTLLRMVKDGRLVRHGLPRHHIYQLP